MTDVAHPFTFSESQFNELSGDQVYAIKKLIYTKSFQELVSKNRRANNLPIEPPTAFTPPTADEIEVSDPQMFRQISDILGKLKCSRRKFLPFAYIYTKFNKIIPPAYFPRPSMDELKHAHRAISGKLQFLSNGDIGNLDKKILLSGVEIMGDPLYANDQVAVRGGKSHVALLLTPQATLKNIEDVFSVVNAYQQVIRGKRKKRGEKDLDRFYAVSCLQRMGVSSLKQIRQKLFDKWEEENPTATQEEGDRVFEAEFSENNINNWMRGAKKLGFM